MAFCAEGIIIFMYLWLKENINTRREVSLRVKDNINVLIFKT